MTGTIDSALTRKNDKDVDIEAKGEQREAEKRRAEDRREGVEEQAPGDMPPHSGTRSSEPPHEGLGEQRESERT
jgi:hypothetical protein